jgi:hypothetical protein
MGKNYGLRLMVTTQFFEWFFCGFWKKSSEGMRFGFDKLSHRALLRTVFEG